MTIPLLLLLIAVALIVLAAWRPTKKAAPKSGAGLQIPRRDPSTPRSERPNQE